MTHVLLTTDVIGGVWDFSWTLAGELKRRAFRVTLLAFGEPSDAQRSQAAEAGAWLVAAPLKLEWMQGSAADVRSAVGLANRLVRELGPDLLHANQFALARVRGVPTVLTLHSDVLSWRRWVEGTGGVPPEWRPYAGLVRGAIERAGGVVAVSRFLAMEARDVYGVDRQVEVIHNGWPGRADAPVMPIGERQRLTVLAGRAWDAAKNVPLAARAAQGWGPGEVVLAGDQRHPESWSVAAVGAPIRPLGRVPRVELDALLGRARVYLSPARYDPFGLLPLQAALAGAPLLLSGIPSYRELWDGVALFFRPDDADDLRRQWQRLLGDRALAADLADRARHRALERFSLGGMADDYVRTYDRVLARARPVPSAPAEKMAA